MDIRIIQRFEDFDGLRPAWNALEARARPRSPFVSHSWLCAWWCAFGSTGEPWVITGWDGSELVAAMPLIRTRQRMGKVFRLRALKSMTASDSPAFTILSTADRATEFLKILKEHLLQSDPEWDVLILERLAASGDAVERLRETFGGDGTDIEVVPFNGSYHLEIASDFDSYFSSLGKSFVKNRKNQNKKLERMGSVSFEDHGADYRDALATFYELENTGWKRDNESSILRFGNLRRFYDDLAARTFEDGSLHLSTLSLDGVPFASVFGLIHDEVFYYLKTGVDYRDESFSRSVSSGQAILYHLLKMCHERQLKAFDFCGPLYDYEKRWTKQVRRKHSVYVYNRGRARVRSFLGLRQLKRAASRD